MAECMNGSFEEFPNVDSHLEKAEEEERSAKVRWVRVANSTEHVMHIKKFTDRAWRQRVQGYKVNLGVTLPIPGIEINPTIGVEQPSVPLVHNKNGSDDANPATDDLAAKTCDKIMINADSDENSKLITIELTKDGECAPFWNTTVKNKHGIIIIHDPDNAEKLSVIPAFGQFKQSNRWKPHPGCKNKNLKRSYDPSQ